MIARSAGVLIPLFSLRTRDDLGRGEILDLASAVDFAAAMGVRVIQLLPLDEGAPGEASPYSAMSVFAIDPVYVSAYGLPGVGRVSIQQAHRNVGSSRVVPRPIYRPIKLALLERAYRASRSRGGVEFGDDFERFKTENRDWIDNYALFRALKERFNWASWETWPEPLMRRDADAIHQAQRELAEPIRMYAWWQFIAHRQWKQMRVYARERGVMIGGDMAFSPSRDSAEVWANQEVFDLERSVGAPPDAFNERGQRWGLPLPRWDAMRASGLALWRARARHAGAMFDLLRVDHVVGLYRTFSFGTDPDAPGAFAPPDEHSQVMQGEETMRALIDAASPCELIAEDLGSVPPWVRASLDKLQIPGYKVMRWEREGWDEPEERFKSPASYPEISLATTGTHDTETLTVWWRMQPLDEREKLCTALGINGKIDPKRHLDENAIDAILEALYAAPSRIVLVPIQDLFGWSARINRPGTVGDSNWTYRIPMSIERLRANQWIKSREAKLRAIAIRTGRFAG